MVIAITGAAGNLGSRLARHLVAEGEHELRLLVHRTPLPADLAAAPRTAGCTIDLAQPETLAPALAGVDVVVHFAGVLFAPRPERFLPTTNTAWFGHLLDAALAAGVQRVVLISFPHVEGPTTPEHPATGRLDGHPISAHATTRLAEEQLLFARTAGTSLTPVVLRVGMVYGKGILMIDAARWLAERRLLGVWREPTWIHLISTPDFLAATTAAATRVGATGIYHVGDEAPLTLQEFLDRACDAWGTPRPWRLPWWTILTAATLSELWATLFRTRSPLTRDFVRIGRVSYCGDTTRFRAELSKDLRYPTLNDGMASLSR